MKCETITHEIWSPRIPTWWWWVEGREKKPTDLGQDLFSLFAIGSVGGGRFSLTGRKRVGESGRDAFFSSFFYFHGMCLTRSYGFDGKDDEAAGRGAILLILYLNPSEIDKY